MKDWGRQQYFQRFGKKRWRIYEDCFVKPFTPLTPLKYYIFENIMENGGFAT